MMGRGLQVALALGAGYFLGRNRKMRLAFMLAAGAATGKLGGAPGQLLRQGTKMLGSKADLGGLTPELSKITDTVRGPLTEAAKAAAMAAVTSQIDSLSDSLRDRAESWSQMATPGSIKEKAGDVLPDEEVFDAEDQIDSLSDTVRDGAGALRRTVGSKGKARGASAEEEEFDEEEEFEEPQDGEQPPVEDDEESEPRRQRRATPPVRARSGNGGGRRAAETAEDAAETAEDEEEDAPVRRRPAPSGTAARRPAPPVRRAQR